jgi:ankyrin repeat domain-containing protein 50
MGRDLSEIKYQLEAQKTDGDRVAIIYWLSTTDPSVNFHASCKKCQPETGKWVVDRGDFNEWRVSRNSFLWIHGIRKCLLIYVHELC